MFYCSNQNSTGGIRQQFRIYMNFKQKLLEMMSVSDPLQILQSAIFEQYEQLAFSPLCYPKSASQLDNEQEIHRHNNLFEMDTKIQQYNINGLPVHIVQKRSHSADRIHCSDNDRKWMNKIRQIQQNRKVDLAIWSNIMQNRLPVSFPKYNNESTQNKQNIPINMQQSQLSQSMLSNSTMSVCVSPQVQSMLKSLIQKIVAKPTPNNVKKIIKHIFHMFQEDSNRIIQHMNKLKKQNDRLTMMVQQYSTKQFEYIVHKNHTQKILQQNKQKIYKLQQKLSQKQQQLLQKQSQLSMLQRHKLRQHGQEESNRRGCLQQLKQKLAIDSIRRTTLCSLNWEKLQIQMTKQELEMQHAGLAATWGKFGNNYRGNSSQRNNTTLFNFTEQTNDQ